MPNSLRQTKYVCRPNIYIVLIFAALCITAVLSLRYGGFLADLEEPRNGAFLLIVFILLWPIYLFGSVLQFGLFANVVYIYFLSEGIYRGGALLKSYLCKRNSRGPNMIKIDFPRFTADYIKRIVHSWDVYYWSSTLSEQSTSMTCSFQFFINEKCITPPASAAPLGLIIPDTLMNINNAFCELLEKGAAMAMFNRPNYLKMRIEGNNILFTNEKILRPDLQAAVKDEPSDLVQAVEEVLRARDEYEKICFQAAHEIKPNEVEEFMNVMMSKKSWRDLKKVWENYK